MPVYSFIHPDTEEEIEVVQKMSEPHVYIDEHGVEWRRSWTSPNAQVDSEIDPFDKKQFNRKIDDTKGTVGDLWDMSREMSEKRTQKLGYDPVKKKNQKKYSKDRMGRKLPPASRDS